MMPAQDLYSELVAGLAPTVTGQVTGTITEDEKKKVQTSGLYDELVSGISEVPKSKWEQAKELQFREGVLPTMGMWGRTGQAENRAKAIEGAGGIGPYVGQLATTEGLEKTGKSLISGLASIPAMIGQMGKTAGGAMATLAGKQPPPNFGVQGGRPASPLEPLKQVGELAMFIPKLMEAVAGDPVKAIQERPLDILMMLSPIMAKLGMKALSVDALTREGLRGALRDVASEVSRMGTDMIPPNMNKALVHVASKLGPPEPGFRMTPGGVGISTRPVPPGLLQEGLDLQSAARAGTMDQGPVLSTEWPTTEPAVTLPPPPAQLLPATKYEVSPGGSVFRPGHTEKTRILTMLREAERRPAPSTTLPVTPARPAPPAPTKMFKGAEPIPDSLGELAKALPGEFPQFMRDRAKLQKRIAKEAPGPAKPRLLMSPEERATMDAIIRTATDEMQLPDAAMPDRLRAYAKDMVTEREMAAGNRIGQMTPEEWRASDTAIGSLKGGAERAAKVEPIAPEPVAPPVARKLVGKAKVTKAEAVADGAKFVGESKSKLVAPKAQKEWLLKKIDEATGKADPEWVVDVAKDGTRSIQKPSGVNKQGDQLYEKVDTPMTVVFDVPGDGQFEITNTVAAMSAFKKLVASRFNNPRLSPTSAPKASMAPPSRGKIIEMLEPGETAKMPGAEKGYYRWTTEGMKEVAGEPVDIGHGIDAFYHDGYIIEGQSGLSFGGAAKNKAEAIGNARATIAKVGVEKTKEYIRKSLEAKTTPRYKRGGGESPPVGLGLQEMRPESMSPAQRAAYDKYMAGKGGAKARPETNLAGVATIAKATGKYAPAGAAIRDPQAPFIEPKLGEAPTIVKRLSDKPTAMPVYKHELDALMAEKDLPSRKVKYAYENPIRVFEESPAMKEMVYDVGREGQHLAVLDNIKVDKTVRDWQKSVKGKGVSKALGDYAIAMQKDGPESLKLMGVDPEAAIKRVENVPQLKAIYEQARVIYEQTFARINEARALLGKDPLPKVENYHTFMRGLKELDSMGFNPITIDDPAVIRMHMSEPTFKYKKRLGVIAPIERDFFAVFRTYMHTADKYINYAPAIAKSRALLVDQKLPDGSTFSLGEAQPEKARYLQSWTDRISGKASLVSPEYSKAARWLSRKIKQNVGASVISYNVRSFGIQWTSLRNTVAEVGPKFVAKGLKKYASPEARKFALEMSQHLKGRSFDVYLEDLMASDMARFVNKGQSKMAQVGTYPLRALDATTANISWLSAYEKAVAPVENGGLGLSGKKAFTYADDVVVKTQASAWRGDIAPIQAGPVGGLLTMLQTFNINDWNYLTKDVLGIHNSKMSNLQRAKKISTYLIGTLLVNEVFEDVLNIQSPMPAPEREIAKLIRGEQSVGETIVGAGREIAEQIPVIGGAIRYTTPTRTALPSGIQQVSDIFKAGGNISNAIAKGDLSKISRYDLENIAKLLGIPGVGQFSKMFSRIGSGENPYNIIVGGKRDEKKSGSSWSWPSNMPGW